MRKASSGQRLAVSFQRSAVSGRQRAFAAAQGEVVVFAEHWSQVQRPHGMFSSDALLVIEKPNERYRLYLRKSYGRTMASLTAEAVRLNGGHVTDYQVELLPMCAKSIEEVLREGSGQRLAISGQRSVIGKMWILAVTAICMGAAVAWFWLW